MSWVQNSKALGRLGLAVSLAAAAVSAAANVIVVRSSGPSAKSYPPGRSLPDDARIRLQASDVVVVLGGGGTRTFRGPGTFSPGAAVRADRPAAAASNGRRARIGAVRNAGLVPRSPTIWHVDVSQSGTFCLADTAGVMLWRPDSSQASSLAIQAPGGASHSVEWPAGQATLAWPASLPIADGGEYRLRRTGVAVPTRITFRALQSEPEDLTAVAGALIERGCQEQLDLLVETAPEENAAQP